jgi:hypothetical protein
VRLTRSRRGIERGLARVVREATAKSIKETGHLGGQEVGKRTEQVQTVVYTASKQTSALLGGMDEKDAHLRHVHFFVVNAKIHEIGGRGLRAGAPASHAASGADGAKVCAGVVWKAWMCAPSETMRLEQRHEVG